MTFLYSLDIVNAEQDKWDDWMWFSFFRDRLIKMRSKRQPFSDSWDQYEDQTNAVSFYDNEWNLVANIPLEKELKEYYMGRTEWKINFDIIPDWQVDIEELQPSKYALNFFLDWNYKDNFWKENKLLRDLKSTYWSWIFYTGIRQYKDFRYVTKEDAELQNWTDILNENNFDKQINETWFFHPKSIHPKDFFIDDAAYGQPDVQYADDCIYKEKVSAIEFLNRYKNNNAIMNLDLVTYFKDINPKNKDDQSIDIRQIVLYHYFNRITKKYLIVANEAVLIFNGLYLYNDWKLPFVNVQHFSNVNRFWWEWYPERVGFLKAYKSEVFQDILSSSAMSSGLHLIVWNDDQIGQDWTLWGRQMNLWRTTGWVDKVQQMNTTPNINAFQSVIALIDKEIAVASWINPNETIEADSDKVWIVEIMEARKSVRNRSVDENYNIWLDESLTMTLDRIKQFAPALLSEKIKDSDWKIIKTIFPKIRINDKVIKKEWGKQIFEEDIGKFWYFELKPNVVQGIGVKIVTPSTNAVLPILERQKITEYINNLNTMIMLASQDQTGEMMKKVKETIQFDQLIDWINDAYGYDSNGLKANTKKDKIKKENIKKIKQIQEFLTQDQNVWQNPTMAWQQPNPTAPTGQPNSTTQPIQTTGWQPATANWLWGL